MSADVREFERLLRRYMLATKRAQEEPHYGANRPGNGDEKRRKQIARHRRFELMEFVRSRLAIGRKP